MPPHSLNGRHFVRTVILRHNEPTSTTFNSEYVRNDQLVFNEPECGNSKITPLSPSSPGIDQNRKWYMAEADVFSEFFFPDPHAARDRLIQKLESTALEVYSKEQTDSRIDEEIGNLTASLPATFVEECMRQIEARVVRSRQEHLELIRQTTATALNEIEAAKRTAIAAIEAARTTARRNSTRRPSD